MATTISFGDANSGFQAGIIEQLHQHLPPERLETPPNPSLLIHYSRDRDFVDREGIIDRLHNKCAVSGSRTALVGLGGVGKSQLAIEYAYQTQERSTGTWIFWIHASNAARFEEAYRNIASYVKIPGRQNATANIFQLVHDWLLSRRQEKWILILDNVDDAEFLFEAPHNGPDRPTREGARLRPLVAYLPRCQNGSILVTSRNQNAALKLVEPYDVIAVGPMSGTDAFSLLERKLDKQYDSDDVAALAAALEFMPLAIVQAAAYISQCAPRCSVRRYLDEFQKSDRKRIGLLNFEAGQLRRDVDAKNSIIITWQISFDRILEVHQSAAKLLSVMSHFDRQNIPESLLGAYTKFAIFVQSLEKGDNNDRGGNDSEASTDDGESTIDEESLERDILVLRNYSFISIAVNGTSFQMHRLVQLAMRTWLKAHEINEELTTQDLSVISVNIDFPNVEVENWAKCRLLFPHAKQLAAAKRPKEPALLAHWTSLLYKAAWYAREVGNLSDSEKMCIQCLEVRRATLEPEDALTLNSMANLAATYAAQGRWSEAEELERQVVEGRKKTLGANHQSTLDSMGNLANIYMFQGRYKLAEELQSRTLEINQNKLGIEHPTTLTCLGNLQTIYGEQARWDEAEKLAAQVLKVSKDKLGTNDLRTLMFMHSLAVVYYSQERYEEAEQLLRQATDKLNHVVGPEDHRMLMTMSSLALACGAQGRSEEAEELETQVLKVRREKFGVDHHTTLISMNNLAMIYTHEGRQAEGRQLLAQVLDMKTKKLGRGHPETLVTMGNLAIALKENGQDAEALDLMRECVSLGRDVLGESHSLYQNRCEAVALWEAERTTSNSSGDVAVSITDGTNRKSQAGQDNHVDRSPGESGQASKV